MTADGKTRLFETSQNEIIEILILTVIVFKLMVVSMIIIGK